MRKPLVGLIAAILVGLMAEPCVACNCVGMDPEQRRDWATVIFSGEVVDLRESWSLPLTEKAAQNLLHRKSGPEYGDVAFKVDRVYKGDVHETQWVSGQGLGASCGFTFRRGATYTVFARERGGGYLETGLCAGVFQDRFSPAEFGLDDGQEPIQGTDTNESDGYALWILAALAALAVGIIFFSSRYVFRRRSASKAGPSL